MDSQRPIGVAASVAAGGGHRGISSWNHVLPYVGDSFSSSDFTAVASVSLACAWAARTASSPVPGALEGYVSQAEVAHIKHAVRNIHLSGAVRLRVSQNYRHLHLSGAVRLRVSQNYRHVVYRRQ